MDYKPVRGIAAQVDKTQPGLTPEQQLGCGQGILGRQAL